MASRDGLLNKDAKVVNALIEAKGDSLAVRKRPGLTQGALIQVGTAQALTHWRGTLRSIIADIYNGTNLTPSSAGLPFQFQDNGADAGTPLLMMKNASQAWTSVPGGAVTQITDVDYPGTYTVTLTSLTRSGSVATATTPTDTNFQVGSTVVIAGATPSAYNGPQVITSVTPSSTVSGKTVSGTIVRSGTTATFTTLTEPHGVTNGQSVTITGALQPEYNGTFVAAYISPTQFSFTVVVTNSQAISGTGFFALAPVVCSVQNTPGALNTFTATIAGAIQDIFVVGEVVTLSGGDVNVTGSRTVATVSAAAGQFTFITSGITSVITATCSVVRAALGASASSWVSGTNTFSGIYSGAITQRFAAGKQLTISNYSTPTSLQNALVTVLSVNASTNGFTCIVPSQGVESPITPATGNITSTVNTTTQVGASFTFNIGGSPATPATGTITAAGGRNTVPGIAYINGYFCVMDENGVIYNSDLDNPPSWSALDYTTAQYENGSGVAIAKSQNYLVAFKQYSTEFFYDAQNPVGSPFSPVENGFTQIGCASGFSVAETNGGLCWVAQVKGQGRSVYFMQGTQQAKISSADVDRVVNRDNLVTVYAYGINVEGHDLYILTLVSSNITLVYDFQSKAWSQWSSLTENAPVSVSSITRVDQIATVTTAAPHGLVDGDPATIAGAIQAEYNGLKQITYISPTSFSFEVTGSPVSPATGTITCAGYTESYFKMTKATNAAGVLTFLHESNGFQYTMSPTVYLDAAVPVSVFTRTQRLDGGSTERKTIAMTQVIGDTANTKVALRWSDDDCQTFTKYRPADLSQQRPMVRRCGAFRRRVIEMKHIENQPINLTGFEL
jgi:hypothetical protein